MLKYKFIQKDHILIQFLEIHCFHIPVIALKIVVGQMVLGVVMTKIQEIIVSIVDMLNAVSRKMKKRFSKFKGQELTRICDNGKYESCINFRYFLY